MLCEKCRMKLSDDMKFCPFCGTAVSRATESSNNHSPVCRKCGASLLPNARFCLKCGTPVEQVPPSNHQLTQKPANFVSKKEQIQKNRKQSVWYIAISVFLIAAVFLTISIGLGSRSRNTSEPVAAVEEAEEATNDEIVLESSENYSEETDSYNEDDYDNVNDTSDNAPLKGILYVTRSSYYGSLGGEFKDDLFHEGDVEIYALDPETGESSLVRSFPLGSYDNSLNGVSPCTIRDDFDENYERLAFDISLSNGENHVGWIDQYGNYTDVTALTTPEKGDFSAPTKQFQGCFGPDNYFYYYEGGGTPYRVPMDNLIPEAVEAVEQYLQLHPNGIVYRRPTNYSNSHDAYFLDESMNQELPEKFNFDSAWIGDGSYIDETSIGYDNYTIVKMNPDGSRTDIIPEITDRWSYNPVVSPDGTQVAFLSSLRTLAPDADYNAYVFLVSTGGGEPVKVSSDVKFRCNAVSDDHLLEWR